MADIVTLLSGVLNLTLNRCMPACVSCVLVKTHYDVRTANFYRGSTGEGEDVWGLKRRWAIRWDPVEKYSASVREMCAGEGTVDRYEALLPDRRLGVSKSL